MLTACPISARTRACQPVGRCAKQSTAVLGTQTWGILRLYRWRQTARVADIYSNSIHIIKNSDFQISFTSAEKNTETVTKTWGFKVPLWGSDHKKWWAILGWDGRNGVWTINILIKLWDTSFFFPNNLYTRRKAARSCTFTGLLPHSKAWLAMRPCPWWWGEACRPRYGRARAQRGL